MNSLRASDRVPRCYNCARRILNRFQPQPKSEIGYHPPLPTQHGKAGALKQAFPARLQCWQLSAVTWPALVGFLMGSSLAYADIRISPVVVELCGPEAAQQLLVFQRGGEQHERDVTRVARFEVADPSIIGITPQGVVLPKRDGRTEVVVRHENYTTKASVEVRQFGNPDPVSFRQEIIPILTKAYCNAGTCHGKSGGQNGFELSVFGSDPQADFHALVYASGGRRTLAIEPDKSLLLRKGSATLPHGGGRKLIPGGLEAQRVRRWISEGAKFDDIAHQRQLATIEVEPAELSLAPRASQQLRVTARYSDGFKRCVTREAEYISNASMIVAADTRGLAQASPDAGEAAILVRYMDQVVVARLTVPRAGVRFVRPPETNFVDHLVWNKLERLGIEPSSECSDSMFMRRVSLDVIGTLPTPDEAKAFIDDRDPQKRSRLIDRILERGEYADHWALRWADLLRADKNKLGPQAAIAMTRWLRRQIAENKPNDQFVHQLITARGNTSRESPAAFYKVVTDPEAMARSLSQLLLGIRIECAQCHHHPSDRWSQDDYYGLAGFFTGLARKPLPGGDEILLVREGSNLKNPRSGATVETRALGAPAATFLKGQDRREELAKWALGPASPLLSRAMANRLWAHYFGRGLVTPVDDLRMTNPASNEPLLDALAAHLREVKYDVKAFTRTLLKSRVYQLSSQTNASNEHDEQNFSHALEKALSAEVLLDAVNQVTGVPEKFNGWPAGYRAIQLWDNHMPSYFLRIFGRPVRASVCECERSSDPSIAQVLHLMNSPEIAAKLGSPEGRARTLADTISNPADIVTELYLSALSRPPRADELGKMLEAFSGNSNESRRAAAQDVLWALINSEEFLCNR